MSLAFSCFFKNNLIYLTIDFWLSWVFVSAWAFSSCSEWGYSPVVIDADAEFLTAMASLVGEHRL